MRARTLAYSIVAEREGRRRSLETTHTENDRRATEQVQADIARHRATRDHGGPERLSLILSNPFPDNFLHYQVICATID